MVQVIAGKRGKGKTKHLLDMANAAIKGAHGTVVYLDKSAQHMYELNNRIRLINVNEFHVTSSEGFLGFISGIISQDHDLETMYLDSFLKLACLDGEDISQTYMALKEMGEKHPILSDRAFENVVIRYLYPPELLESNDIYGFGHYKDMIDKYFKTDYGRHHKKKYGTEFFPELSLSHFMSDEIRTNLAKKAFQIPY